jgi:copper oxidase (laccase) domain-containing protein
MFLRDINPFVIEEDALLLPEGFPALAGITNRKAGDFGYTDLSYEYRISRLFAKAVCGDISYSKLFTRDSCRIIYSKKFVSYQSGDGLINFDDSADKTPGLLISVTNDSSTVVFASTDQSLIAIINCGWKGCRLNIVRSAVKMIKEKTGIEAENLAVGIFPGICGRCNIVKYDVGLFFPGYYIGKRLDLSLIIQDKLYNAGIKRRNIFVANYCSCCSQGLGNHPFFSQHQYDTGKNAVFICRR